MSTTALSTEYTYEECFEIARNFTTVAAWRKYSRRSYHVAKRHDWIEKCGEHFWETAEFKPIRKSSKSLEKSINTCELINEASVYETLEDWQQASPKNYAIAQERNCIKDCKRAIAFTHGTAITMVDCEQDAKQFVTRDDWQNQSPIFYEKALKNNWITTCCAHFLTVEQSKLTKLECISDAGCYSSKSNWKLNSISTYNTARKRGWLEECLAQFKRSKSHY